MEIFRHEWALAGPALMAVWSKALPLTAVASCLSPLPGFESRPGHVRKLPVTLGKAVVFARYSDFLNQLQLASHDLPQHGRKSDENQNSKFHCRHEWVSSLSW